MPFFTIYDLSRCLAEFWKFWGQQKVQFYENTEGLHLVNDQAE